VKYEEAITDLNSSTKCFHRFHLSITVH